MKAWWALPIRASSRATNAWWPGKPPPIRAPAFAFFVMNSGLRSARDKILLYFEEAFARQTMTRGRLFSVVNLYAQQVRRVCEEDGEALQPPNSSSMPTR